MNEKEKIIVTIIAFILIAAIFCLGRWSVQEAKIDPLPFFQRGVMITGNCAIEALVSDRVMQTYKVTCFEK